MDDSNSSFVSWKGIFKAIPDNIWYHDYQIVKVNPGIEIQDEMIADLGNLEEFKQFVKTVSFQMEKLFS